MIMLLATIPVFDPDEEEKEAKKLDFVDPASGKQDVVLLGNFLNNLR